MKVIFTIVSFLAIFIMPLNLQAVMPAPHSEHAELSVIKAIALVENIKRIDSYTSKILFILERSFTEKSVQKFVATCPTGSYTVKQPGIMTGGTLYYSPHKGDRALVTVDDHGYVSSYTKMSPRLDKELKQNGLKNIYFSAGYARIRNNNYLP